MCAGYWAYLTWGASDDSAASGATLTPWGWTARLGELVDVTAGTADA